MTTDLHEIFVQRLIAEITDPYSPDEVLSATDLTEGILDSLGIIEILELITDVFGVVVPDDDVRRQDFVTVATIKALVESHVAQPCADS